MPDASPKAAAASAGNADWGSGEDRCCEILVDFIQDERGDQGIYVFEGGDEMASLKSENAIVKGDIRILTLYKQHYFDQNDEPLKCQFTCWGYYDGLDVVQPPKKGSALFTKKTEAPVSPIWFGLGKSAGGLCGRYSKQNIGIFRCPDSNRENWNLFWNSRCA